MAEQGPHYSSQTKARKAALDILFMAEQREASVSETFAEQRTLAGTTVRPLTTDIVLGVAEHQQEIDQRIAESTSMNWPLERMPSVDRNLARLAIYELDYTDTPPAAVTVSSVSPPTALTFDWEGGLPTLIEKIAAVAAK